MNTIKAKKYFDIIEEKTADATITPGMLIEFTSTGVKAHATSGGSVTPVMFALEDALQGKDIDDDYVAGDKVQCWIAGRGEKVYALLADGEVTAIGSKLISNGDGTLKVLSQSSEGEAEYPNCIVAVADEVVDMSGSSLADPSGRIVVTIV